MNANININTNVDSIVDALRAGRKKTTYDRALKEWVGSWSSFKPSDSLVSCGSILKINGEVTTYNCYEPEKIIVNGPATIVFWQDGTKTVVKCAKGESWDIYNAFTAALAIKIFGSNSKIKKILKIKVEWPDDFTLAVKED